MDRQTSHECVCVNCKTRTTTITVPNRIVDSQNSKLRDEIFNINKRIENPVNTSNLYKTINLPDRFEHSCK